MGDQHDGGAESLTQIAQQLKDLRLNRHIECGGWLICNEQLWFAGECHGDHHALRHAARDLVRVGIGASTRIWNADKLQQLNAAHARRLLIKPLMNAQHLADLVGELLHRVQRGVRLLEDHRDAIPTNLLHLQLCGGEQILAVKADAPASDLAGWRDQAQDGEGGDALSAARLAHKAEHLAAINAERCTVHRAHHTVAHAEGGL